MDGETGGLLVAAQPTAKLQITQPRSQPPLLRHRPATITRTPPSFPLPSPPRPISSLPPNPNPSRRIGLPGRGAGPWTPCRRTSAASAPTASSGAAAPPPCPTRPSARSTTSRPRSAPHPPRCAPRYAGRPAPAPPPPPPHPTPTPPPTPPRPKTPTWTATTARTPTTTCPRRCPWPSPGRSTAGS